VPRTRSARLAEAARTATVSASGGRGVARPLLFIESKGRRRGVLNAALGLSDGGRENRFGEGHCGRRPVPHQGCWKNRICEDGWRGPRNEPMIERPSDWATAPSQTPYLSFMTVCNSWLPIPCYANVPARDRVPHCRDLSLTAPGYGHTK